jgi:hypothetical protein
MSRGIFVSDVLGGVEIQVNDKILVLSRSDFLELLKRLEEMRRQLDPRLLKP